MSDENHGPPGFDIARLREDAEKHRKWRDRRKITEPVYLDLLWHYKPADELIRLEADQKIHKTIEIDLHDAVSLPAIELKAFAPLEVLSDYEKERVFAPDTLKSDRRQMLNHWNLENELLWHLDEISDRADRGELKPGEKEIFTYAGEKNLGGGRKIGITAYVTTKTEIRHDDGIDYNFTTFDKLKLDITHTPAQIKAAGRQAGIG